MGLAQWWRPTALHVGLAAHARLVDVPQLALAFEGRLPDSLFGLALRQSLDLVESMLRLTGLTWRVPNFSTVCRRQKDLNV